MTVFRILGSEPLSECTYLIAEQGKALIVDPGVTSDTVLDACRDLSLDPIAVLLTHGHYDHILGAKGLQEKGIPVYAHEEEFEVISGRANLALAFGASLPPLIPDVALHDEDRPSLSPFDVRVIFTPGHTQGGVCYLVNGALFSGDTLFPGSYGRTDFPTGDEQDLICSIANTLFELSPDTPVYSGHGLSRPGCSAGRVSPAVPDTTIGQECSTNPILYLL